MKANDIKPKKCNDADENFRCACVDCAPACPELPELQEAGSCHVGVLPCLSFAAILTYGVVLLLLATAIVGHIVWAKHSKKRSERLRLLQDASPSDDEDESDIVHSGAMYDRLQRNYWLNSVCDASARCADPPGGGVRQVGDDVPQPALRRLQGPPAAAAGGPGAAVPAGARGDAGVRRAVPGARPATRPTTSSPPTPATCATPAARW